jgi:hypothetical protein
LKARCCIERLWVYWRLGVASRDYEFIEGAVLHREIMSLLKARCCIERLWVDWRLGVASRDYEFIEGSVLHREIMSLLKARCCIERLWVNWRLGFSSRIHFELHRRLNEISLRLCVLHQSLLAERATTWIKKNRKFLVASFIEGKCAVSGTFGHLKCS